MIPFKSPAFWGGRSPLIQNYPEGAYSGAVSVPAGAKFLTIEALSPGATPVIGEDTDENGWMDYCASGAGGAYAAITYPTFIIPSTLTVVAGGRTVPDAVVGNSYVYFNGVGYGLLVQAPSSSNPGTASYNKLSGYSLSSWILGQAGQIWNDNEPPVGDVLLRGGAAAQGGSLAALAGAANMPVYDGETRGNNYGGGGAITWRPYVAFTRGPSGGGYVRLTWSF